MGAFFDGYGRKTGCLLLALAAVFSGAWLRSFASTNDVIQFNATYSLYSHDGSLSWNCTYPDDSLPMFWQMPLVADEGVQNSFVIHPVSLPTFKWRHELCGFVASEISINGRRTIQYWVPYWAITMPLLLICAWLLLKKPPETVDTAKN